MKKDHTTSTARRGVLASGGAMAISRPAAVTAKAQDPVFAAIERLRVAEASHEAACDAYYPFEDREFRKPKKSAKYVAAEAKANRACDASTDAFDALIATVPTTRAGLKAMVSYLAQSSFRHDAVPLGDLIDTIEASLQATG